MLAKFSKSIYHYARSNTYYDIIEVLSELQIQLSLLEIHLLLKGNNDNFSMMASIIQPISLAANLRSPELYDYFMDNHIMIWIIDIILGIYLVIPLIILFSTIKIKYDIIPNFAYSWISYFGYIHLYIISYIIHGWLVYQFKKSISYTIINSVILGFSLIFIFINIIVSVIICKVCISQVYLPGFISHKFAYNRWLNLIFKFAFPIFELFEPSSIKTIIFLIFLIIWGILRQFKLIIANPFHNYTTIKLISGMQGITCGIIILKLISAILQTQFENTSNICGILLFFLSSFSSKCFISISDQKVNKTLFKMGNLIDIDYASQYCLIEQFTNNIHRKGFKEQNIRQNELISNGLLFSHKVKCNECHDQSSLQIIRNHLLANKILEGLNSHKQSFILNCLAINFYFNQKYDIYRSFILIEKIKKLAISIEDKLVLKAYELKIQEVLYNKNNDSNIDYGSFASYENFYETFLCSIKNATATYIRFWSEVNSPMPNLLNLIKISIQIQKDHENFKKAMRVYQTKFINNFAKVSLLAGLYYDILKNNHDKSFFLLQKYRKFMIHHYNFHYADQITKDAFYPKDNVNIRISGSDDSLGTIISCSGNITDVINLNARKLIGQNITQILPNFLIAHHSNFIREYKETGISNVINQTTYQFCKHEYGYLISVKAHISIYPILDNGLMFLGIVRVINTNYDYILINEDGKIEGMTLDISRNLNYKANFKIHFTSLLDFNRYNNYKDLNIDSNLGTIQEIGKIQIEEYGSSQLIDKTPTNSICFKNKCHFFPKNSKQSINLFQNFVEDYLKNTSKNGKKLVLKKILVNNNYKKVINDSMIDTEYIEYKVWLEKNCYKFGLQIYVLKLFKIDGIQKKFNLEHTISNTNTNAKMQLKKSINYEDNISMVSLEEYRKESTNILINNQPFAKKPEFVRELIYNSNNNNTGIKSNFSAKKKVSYSIKFQSEDKTSSISINTNMPKINNLVDLNTKFQEENTIRKETIISNDEFYAAKNIDESYSIKSIYFYKNTKMKSKFHKKEKNVPSHLLKFHSIFLEMNTLFMIILFLLSITGMFVIYGISARNISKIDKDLMISYYCNQRSANLIEIDRRLRSVWLVKAGLMSDKRLEWRNISSQYSNSLKRGYEASQYLIGNNTLIARYIQDIDTISQNDFYSQLVKLYSIDKFGERLLSNYTETNSFIAGYQIYSMVNRIRKLSITQITLNYSQLFFVLRNSLNDIYIEYERSSRILINEIYLLITNIKQISFGILIAILTISIICIILLMPGLSALFYKKNQLLMQIVNINLQYCQFHVYRIKQFFNGLQENYSDTEFINIYDENKIFQNEFESKKEEDQNKRKSKVNYKRMVNTFGIKLDLAKSFLIFLGLLIIYITIFYTKNIIVGTYMDDINIAIQRILFSSRMFAQQSFAMAIIYEYIGENGTTIVENKPIDLIINQTMPIIGDLQGFLTNFRDQKGDLDQSLEFLMIGNTCTIVPPDYVADCITLGGGPGQNGISSINSYVYKALSTALLAFQSSNRTTEDAFNTLSLWYLRNLEAIFYRITMTTYSYLYNQLLGDLNIQIESYKAFGLGWALASFFSLLVIEMIIWLPTNSKLNNEILSMRRIMKIIPTSIINKSKIYKNR